MNSKINFIIFLIFCSIVSQSECLELATCNKTTDYPVIADKHSTPCDIIPSIVNLPTVTDVTSGPISLTGIPAGGVFSGNGILFSAFNPILAGPGIHEITYTYTDPATGCVSTATEVILVFTLVDAWVIYNLGFIQPKLGFSSDSFTALSGEYDLRISDLSGRIVHQTKAALTKGFQLHTFNEIDLPYGLYVATLQNNEHTFSKQLILGR